MAYTGHEFETGETLSAAVMNALDDGVLERYIKPTAGIPKGDMTSSVQTSLSAADSAIQGVKLNGTTITPSSNVVDVVLSDYRTATAQAAIDSTKVDKVTGKGLSESDFTYKEKRQLANIAALLKGTEYTVETGTSPAYTQTVPTGAQTYAEIGSVGGRTTVFRQFLRDGQTAFTIDKTTSSSSWNKYCHFPNASTYIDGSHKYGVIYTIDAVSGLDSIAGATNIFYTQGKTTSGGSTVFPIVQQLTQSQCVAGTYFNSYTSGITSSALTGDSTFAFAFTNDVRNDTSAPDASITFSNVMLFDLTELFGSGNEPTTLADFHVKFPSTYYSVDAGSLLSTSVTSVISKDADETILQTITIPEDVRGLTGYGWSFGPYKNYIDFKNKKYIRQIGSITYDGSSDEEWTYKYFTSSGVNTNYLYEAKYITGCISQSSDIWTDNCRCILGTESKIITVNNTNIGYGLISRKFRYRPTNIVTDDDCATWKAQLAANPITVYYALAQQSETDISSYLSSDNFIQVEEGGNVIFNQGDTLHFSVPNTINYMVKVSDSI